MAACKPPYKMATLEVLAAVVPTGQATVTAEPVTLHRLVPLKVIPEVAALVQAATAVAVVVLQQQVHRSLPVLVALDLHPRSQEPLSFTLVVVVAVPEDRSLRAAWVEAAMDNATLSLALMARPIPVVEAAARDRVDLAW